MTSVNVHKIFKRSTVDVKLLPELGHILDYDFFRQFAPEVTRLRREPESYNIGDTEVLFIRYVVDLQMRVQVLEQRWEAFRGTDKAE